ncbi:hypothetical protein FKW77_001690 [Venturia effusa]|uniref:SGNH hydrolase-type esterase domain-containing protein n=1 Tax=Venturia effusa TaxID=50376 RepID=A0A517LDA5_9PEZI|nr:hypothetical protein FKW77_001690 [Venturia effusa]
MKLSNTQLIAAIAFYIPLCSAYPKLIIAGGTNVADRFGERYRGWSGWIDPLLNVSVMHQAIPQSSVRNTFNTPGWQRTLALVGKDDYVVLEYGLDDEGNPQERGKEGGLNLRPSLPGIGDETVTLQYSLVDTRRLPNGTVEIVKGSARNVTEVVHTFGWYLKNMVVDIRDRDAHVIISSRIPKNWKTVQDIGNKTTYTLSTDYKFKEYAQQVAEQLKVDFVDHTYYTLRYLQELGPVASQKLYGYKSLKPGGGSGTDLFTSKEGGKATAETFIQALRCSGSDLVDYLSDDGLAVETIIC